MVHVSVNYVFIRERDLEMESKRKRRRKVRGRRSLRRIGAGVISAVLVAALAFTLLPQEAARVLAAESVEDTSTRDDWQGYKRDSTQHTGRIWTDKSVSQTDVSLTSTDGTETVKVDKTQDSDFLVSLSALSSASSLTTMTAMPLDIVLVLDQSGSMAYDFDNDNTRQAAMKAAVDNFIDAIYESSMQDGEGGVYHTLGIVTYGSNSSTLRSRGNIETGYQNYVNAISNLPNRLSGSTNTGEGMNTANNMLPAATEGRKSIVVLFTDGVPTTSSEFNNSVANNAISAANTMKTTKNATVYSIGIFDDADPTFLGSIGDTFSVGWGEQYSEAKKANRFMNLVSSNSTSADSLGIESVGWTNSVTDNFDCDTTLGYYKSASNSDELNAIFDEIAADINEATGPTKVTSGAEHLSGYITFTDTLGAYMQVDDFNAVVYAGEKFDQKSKTTTGSVDTYVFTGTVEGNDIYKAGDMGDLIIQVDRSGAKEVVTVNIPATLIPLRYFDVSTDDDGTTMDIKEAYPIRVFYSVSLKDEVETALMNGTADDALKNYISSNMDDTGKQVQFYSNDYTAGSANGTTTAVFEPSAANSFYYFTELTALYADKNGTTPATSVTEGNTYYYEHTYYVLENGTVTEKTEYYEVTGLRTQDVTRQNGQYYANAGVRKTSKAGEFEAAKEKNETGTAVNAISPSWSGASTVSVALGNNGRLSLAVPGTLSVTKQVQADEGFTLPEDYEEQEFTFTLNLTNLGENAPENFTAEIVKGTETVDELNVKDGDTFRLKHGETLKVYGLPDGAGYEVTEQAVTGYAGSSTGDTGTIAANTESAAVFTNTYTADPLVYSGTANLGVTKIFDGRDTTANDSFTFILTADENNPDAVAVPAQTELTITMPDGTTPVTSDMAVFGDITFTKPGTYIYYISEKDGDIPGVDYTQIYYRVTVTVTPVDGQLRAQTAYAQINNTQADDYAYDSDEGLVFTNTYDAESAQVYLGGQKVLNGRTLNAGEFTFRLVSVGEDGTTYDTADAVPEDFPLPAVQGKQQTVGAETTNGQYAAPDADTGSVYFGQITFDKTHIGHTYSYTIEEVNGNLGGVTYDATTTRTVVITVSEDTTGGEPVVAVAVTGDSTEYPYFTFTNTYEPQPVTLDGDRALRVQKTLTGREWQDGETYTFGITNTQKPADVTDAPMPAGDAGMVTEVTTGKPASGAVSTADFPAITFDKAGTYIYEVTETSDVSGGITKDTHTAEITVTVTDNLQGQLVAEVTYDNSTALADADKAVTDLAAFTNSYSATGTLSLEVAKDFTGRPNDAWLTTDSFSFSVAADEADVTSGAVIMPAGTTAEINYYDDDKKIAFGNITFTKPGEYTFTVTEAQGNIQGVTYDANAERIVTVTVTDNLDGTLTPSVTAVTPEADGTDIVFHNVYTAGPVTVNGAADLQVIKTVEGRDTWLDGETYSFTIVNESKPDTVDTAPMPAETTIELGKPQEGMMSAGSFGDIQFTEQGTYTYLIAEVQNPAAGMTMSQAQYRVTVEVTDGNRGSLVANVTMTRIQTDGGETDNTVIQDHGADFINTYSAAAVTNTPVNVTKVLTGREPGLQENEFSFAMLVEAQGDSPEDGFTMPGGTNPAIASNGANGRVSFGDITFTEVGTYKVTVTEQIPDTRQPFITYDEHTYSYLVTVTDNMQEGRLETAISEVTGDTTFTNTYDAGSSTKTVGTAEDPTTNIDGQMVGVGSELVYTIHWVNDALDDSGQSAAAEISITDTIPAGTEFVAASNGGTATGGVVTWNLGEQEAGASGEVTLTVRVTEAAVTAVENEATLTIGENVTTTNKTTNPVPEKTVENTSAPDDAPQVGDTLTYTVSYANTEEEAATVKIADVLAEGLTYVDGSASNGGVYDEDSHTITWTLENVGSGVEGTVTFQAVVNEKAVGETIENQAELTIGDNPAVKTNTTQTEIKSGSLQISKEIVLTPNQGTQIDTAKEFTFDVTLKDKAGNELNGTYNFAGTSDGTTEYKGPLRSGDHVTLKHGGEIVISNLPEGASYTLTERAENNYTPDEAEKSGTIAADTTAEAAFVNTYDVTAFAGVPAEFTLTKVLEGKDWTENDSFTFTLAAENNAPMPADGTVMVDSTMQTDNRAKFNFGAISYTSAGTYKYTVTETEGNNPGIDYADNVAEITVTVTDNQGTLTAAATVVNGTFTNRYSTEVDYDANGGLSVVKELTGHALLADQFTFAVTPADEASAQKAGMDSVAAKEFKNKAAGMTNGVSTDTMTPLAGMKFTQEDSGKTYTYTISETSGGGAGYTNDTTVYTVEITTQDDGNGVLTVTTVVTADTGAQETYTYTNAQGQAQPAVLTFYNKYEAGGTLGGDGNVALEATKTLNGTDMDAGEFTFLVKDKSGAEVSRGTNAAADNGIEGAITFDSISYTIESLEQAVADGNATVQDDGNGNRIYALAYTVEEDLTSLPAGMSAETQVPFDITVNVKDNGDGTLDISVTYPTGGVKFVNTYGDGTSAAVYVRGTKRLDSRQGLTPPDITGKYTFTLAPQDGAKLPELGDTAGDTAVNDAANSVYFGRLVFTMDDLDGVDAGDDGSRTKQFVYNVTETGSVDGITNDAQSTRTFTVTVTDDGNGKLSADISLDENSRAFTFINTYDVTPTGETSPTDGSVTLTKTLEGRALNEGEFAFTMTDKDGNVVSTGYNDAQGNVVLPGIVFDTPGTYTYTIAETNGGLGGVTYDSRTYTATAEVTDNSDGTMSVAWTVTDGENTEVDEAVFENTYAVSGTTSVRLGAAKQLEGREMKEGEFTFLVTDADGNVVAEAVNDENGSVQFDELVFDRTGTYVYTVSEKAGKDETITYDKTAYQVTVTIGDDLQGHLTAAVDTEDKELVFTNKYTEPAKEVPKTDNDKPAAISTGDNGAVRTLLFVTIIAFTAAAAVVVLKIRRNRR